MLNGSFYRIIRGRWVSGEWWDLGGVRGIWDGGVWYFESRIYCFGMWDGEKVDKYREIGSLGGV